jgi:hypothetical protein
MLRIEREYGSIRQLFFGFAQRRFKNEFADGLARRRHCNVCLADVLSRRSSFSVLFLR